MDPCPVFPLGNALRVCPIQLEGLLADVGICHLGGRRPDGWPNPPGYLITDSLASENLSLMYKMDIGIQSLSLLSLQWISVISQFRKLWAS